MKKRDVVQYLKKYVRAANYLSAIQIYLQYNILLEEKLTPEDIKPRLLGHWGTCPGINFVYANLNYLIKKHNLNMMFVLGPGHGYPGLQANLFIEGTLAKFYPNAKQTNEGIEYITKNFSFPYGFPSHSNPGTPGVILEGGELGYALSTSYGAILDNTGLIVACLVGDGEAETGPTAAAWHLNKFIDPKTNGAVLPILHLNGYKISGPTIFGRMSNKELKSLFYGYGYCPIIVEGKNPYSKMINALEKSYKIIKDIQIKARGKSSLVSPRFPMIILKTPKGWTGIKNLDGDKLEGNCLSHQVIAKEAKENKIHLTAVEKWLKSYKFYELFDRKSGFIQEIMYLVPKNRMGSNIHAFAKDYKPLKLPDIKKFEEEVPFPGIIGSSSMRRTGSYLNEVFKLNKKNFRLFSPDETYSNKLDEIFRTTKRAFVWPLKSWDRDISPSGRVIEILSEHSLQGLAQGYILTGRHCIFASYEAFVEIVSSMADQYAKFLSQANTVSWRGNIASLNYILTSSGWRQEHNGFSHQNPKFITGMLEKSGDFTRVYFPPDGNSTLVVLEHCLKSKNGINIIVAGKTLEPRWLTAQQAREAMQHGMMTWEFASDKNPDIIFAAAGDYLTKESLAAIQILNNIAPEIKIRFVNIVELSSFGIGSKTHMAGGLYEKYFTKNKPVIVNYHGYPNDIKQMLLYQNNPGRFSVHGYTEHGSTTTPFDMHVRNETSRYHLVTEALSLMAEMKVMNKEKSQTLIQEYQKKLKDHCVYIKKHGVDPIEISEWKWKANI